MTADKTLRDAVAQAIARAISEQCDWKSFLIDADAALSVVTEHWNERLEALAQELDTLHEKAKEDCNDFYQRGRAYAYNMSALGVRALKEGQQ